MHATSFEATTWWLIEDICEIPKPTNMKLGVAGHVTNDLGWSRDLLSGTRIQLCKLIYLQFICTKYSA